MKFIIPLLLLCFNLFSQNTGGGLTDIDGNNYTTVIIGSQEWMSENLRTTKYSNGNPIPMDNDDVQWSSLTTGAWVNYDYIEQSQYGRLYNWYSIIDQRKLCPTGWNIPTREDWITLTDNLGGLESAGGKMKIPGFEFWNSPNTNATNESGFSGIPGGYRLFNSDFVNFGNFGRWWSSTQESQWRGWHLSLGYIYGNATIDVSEFTIGASVRCVKTSSLGITENNLIQTKKEIVKIVDLMGNVCKPKPNIILIYFYSDGTYEKKLLIE